jgi:hypothetical protein
MNFQVIIHEKFRSSGVVNLMEALFRESFFDISANGEAQRFLIDAVAFAITRRRRRTTVVADDVARNHAIFFGSLGSFFRWGRRSPGPSGARRDNYTTVAYDIDMLIAAREKQAGGDEAGEQERGCASFV